MQKDIIIGILGLGLAASLIWSALLTQKVANLEKLMAPFKAQQAAQARLTALRSNFDRKMTQDQQKYSQQQPANDGPEISRH